MTLFPDALKPMNPRDIDQPHRAATPLELLFDLVSVIAIAAAAAGLHHSIAENHITEGILRYLLAFFGIWWAWMNYTWFASAYDNDDVLFRLLTAVVMAGALTMAAGIGAFFDSLDISLMVSGYVVMRIAMVVLWLRAAQSHPECRKTNLTYAIGIGISQGFWILLMFLQPLPVGLFASLFVLGGLLELLVPVVAERHQKTPWHRHHIIERYGLLNIIVLGETLLAGSIALQKLNEGDFNIQLVHVALSAMVILFSMWWLYFGREEHLETRDLSRALTWGYGHVLVFLAGAATGAGFAALTDIVTDHAEVSMLVGDYGVAIPVALYLVGLWFVRDRFILSGAARFCLPIFALGIIAIPPVAGLEGIAVLTALSIPARTWSKRRYEPVSI